MEPHDDLFEKIESSIPLAEGRQKAFIILGDESGRIAALVAAELAFRHREASDPATVVVEFQEGLAKISLSAMPDPSTLVVEEGRTFSPDILLRLSELEAKVDPALPLKEDKLAHQVSNYGPPFRKGASILRLSARQKRKK